MLFALLLRHFFQIDKSSELPGREKELIGLSFSHSSPGIEARKLVSWRRPKPLKEVQ